MDDIANIRLTARPGAAWQYSNQNYLLAGYLVEKVTGQTWEQYTRRTVLGPLGMDDADFDIDTMQQRAPTGRRRSARTAGRLSAFPFSKRIFANLALMGPAGSINASIFDMARFAMFQLGDGTSDGRRIVSRAMLDAMHKRQIGLRRASGGHLPCGAVFHHADGVRHGLVHGGIQGAPHGHASRHHRGLSLQHDPGSGVRGRRGRAHQLQLRQDSWELPCACG